MMKIHTERHCRNWSAWVEAPTVRPIRMVTTSISGPLAVLARRLVTPDSLIRLPKKSIPSSGIPDGTMKAVSRKPMIGKSFFSTGETGRGGFMRIRRSFFVVSSRMIGGCITGTRAI